MFLESWHQVDIFTLVSWLSHSIADSKTGLPEIFREAPLHFAIFLFLTDCNFKAIGSVVFKLPLAGLQGEKRANNRVGRKIQVDCSVRALMQIGGGSQKRRTSWWCT